MIGRYASGRERPSLRWIAAGLVVALVAALGGWLVAKRIAAAPAAAPHAQEETLAAGPARLRVSTGWARVARPPQVPGLAQAPAWTPYVALATTVSVKLVPVDDASLVPASLIKQAKGGLPAPEAAKVVGLQARAYRGVRVGTATLDVYAIPTTRGVLTLVCRAPDGGPEAPAWCLNGLDQITVEGAKPLKPDASTAFRLRAPALLKTLDRERVAGRKALGRARKSNEQAKAALALAGAHSAAADALAPLAPPKTAYAALVGVLRNTSGAYRGLATAADHRNKRAWARARSRVADTERALNRALAKTR